MRYVRLTLVLVLLSAAACGGNGGDAGESGDAAAVSITSPEDGATVPSTFQVAMEAEDFTVEPAGEVRDGAGHFHLIVDADCVASGEQIPADETHLHLADGASETRLTLPAGRHTLCLQAGDGGHTALGLTDTVTITVAGSSGGETTTNADRGDPIEIWSGTYDGEVVWDCGPAGRHRGTLEARFEIAVWPTEDAAMIAEHTVTGSCADSGRLTTELRVDGTKTDAEFMFPSDIWGIPGTFSLPVNGNRAEGRLSGAIPGPATMTIVFDASCRVGC